MKCELLAGMLKSLFGGNDMKKWGKVMENSDLGGQFRCRDKGKRVKIDEWSCFKLMIGVDEGVNTSTVKEIDCLEVRVCGNEEMRSFTLNF